MSTSEPLDWRYQEPDVASEVTRPLATSLREARASVTYRWLERIEDRVEVGPNQVFPTEELLDHVPLLVDAIADFMENPAEEGSAADEVMAKAAELGRMRFQQKFSTYQVLKEFEILGGVILAFLRTRVGELGFPPDPEDVVVVTHRIYRAVSKIQQATAARHIAMLEEERRDLDQRLRLVADLVDALDAPLDAALEAGAGSDAARLLVGRIHDLGSLSETGQSSRRRGVPLEGVVNEAVRRVRPIAGNAGLEVEVVKPLPEAMVPDAEVEHCLVVYLTNAIRHCTEVDGTCSVRVLGEMPEDSGELVVAVSNSGRPVERTDDITSLGEPAGVEGEPRPGVGLRFARDLVASLGGRTWAEPDEIGSRFSLALPSRRHDDRDGQSAM